MIDQSKLADLHDEEIVGIFYDRLKKQLDVWIRSANRKDIKYSFDDCLHIRATDMGHQNVISEVRVLAGLRCSKGELISLVKWTSRLSENDSYLSEDKIEKLCGQIQSGSASIVHFVPSVGAEISVVTTGRLRV